MLQQRFSGGGEPFNLLGVDFAREGKKAVEWGAKVSALGVVLDLKPEGENSNYVTIGHTETRVKELCQLIEGIEQRKTMSAKDAERLRWRLQWFETLASGRVAQQAIEEASRPRGAVGMVASYDPLTDAGGGSNLCWSTRQTPD